MAIGEIAGPFGVRGEIKVNLLTDFPHRFNGLRHVHIGEGRERYEVERSRSQTGRILLKLRNIDTPEQVKALGRAEVAVPRDDAVDLPEGHYYLDEVVGAVVTTVEGREIGRVTEVLRTGSNDVFVVGRGRDGVLIPVIRDAVAELDVGNGRVVIQSWVLDVVE
ncbi:MAG TPA: ribosome maturation factor RimM [Chloroflexota bacterium]